MSGIEACVLVGTYLSLAHNVVCSYMFSKTKKEFELAVSNSNENEPITFNGKHFVKFPNKQQFAFLTVECYPDLLATVHKKNASELNINHGPIAQINNASAWSPIEKNKPVILQNLGKLNVGSFTKFYFGNFENLMSISVNFDIGRSNSDNKMTLYTSPSLDSKYASYLPCDNPLSNELIKIWSDKDIELAYKYCIKKATFRSYTKNTLYAIGHPSICQTVGNGAWNISDLEEFKADTITDDLDQVFEHCYGRKQPTFNSFVQDAVTFTSIACVFSVLAIILRN